MANFWTKLWLMAESRPSSTTWILTIQLLSLCLTFRNTQVTIGSLSNILCFANSRLPDMDPNYSVLVGQQNRDLCDYKNKSGGVNSKILSIVLPMVASCIILLFLSIIFYARYNLLKWYKKRYIYIYFFSRLKTVLILLCWKHLFAIHTLSNKTDLKILHIESYEVRTEVGTFNLRL